MFVYLGDKLSGANNNTNNNNKSREQNKESRLNEQPFCFIGSLDLSCFIYTIYCFDVEPIIYFTVLFCYTYEFFRLFFRVYTHITNTSD